MNYKKAFEILEIDTINTNNNDITIELIKKKYHKLALQNHPDKNGNTYESNEQFKECIIGTIINNACRRMIVMKYNPLYYYIWF